MSGIKAHRGDSTDIDNISRHLERDDILGQAQLRLLIGDNCSMLESFSKHISKGFYSILVAHQIILK